MFAEIKSESGVEFTVLPNGDIFQPYAVSQFIIDEVRLSAAHGFLGEKTLSKEQRDYWACVARKTEIKNFAIRK